ncbi:hypothetical protein TSTA_040210 [Talaromyces stipitatus ATCC 10500]|uniref:Uncharacterized protein n=1 Tax=Talaromyces stipitatus (strain ATCC 10500 / CBS 375.48 / QM 6759 / NRRL 1006) TaxID=441959 RepID=B8M484_TALSN|nr:uncharacterized protein TSTA_040210 [Talaromyces stipitatus ATCC 10500]EED20827.1 hypothetical protein TSTA_040210 [Talaromyces stipitatus ATCC 10500]
MFKVQPKGKGKDKIRMDLEDEDKGGNHAYVKIHVCQASYGDCLALEFDENASSEASVGLKVVENTPLINVPNPLLNPQGQKDAVIGTGSDMTMVEEKGKKKVTKSSKTDMTMVVENGKKDTGIGGESDMTMVEEKGKKKVTKGSKTDMTMVVEKGKKDVVTGTGTDKKMVEEKEKKKVVKDPTQIKLIQDSTLEKHRKKGKTRKVILIDGGPGNYQIHGTRVPPTTPLAVSGLWQKVNMYAMLNTLVPKGSPNTLDTLVITHDDADHINGIHQLMMSMADRSGAGHPDFQFARGVEALEDKKPPFNNIWYNSPTLLFKNNRAKGWLDQDIETLEAKWNVKMPRCNAEFGKIPNEIPAFNKVIGGEDAKTLLFKGKTERGRLQFQFLSPNYNQVYNLKKLYEEGKKTEKKSREEKVDKPSNSGKGSKGGTSSKGDKDRGRRGEKDRSPRRDKDKGLKGGRGYSKGGKPKMYDDSEDEEPDDGKGRNIKAEKAKASMARMARKQILQGIEWEGLPSANGNAPIYSATGVAEEVRLSEEHENLIAERITGNPRDSSAKNQSSLVFVVRDKANKFSAAFTGDGNATASFLQMWDGPPIRYNVLKSKGQIQNKTCDEHMAADRLTTFMQSCTTGVSTTTVGTPFLACTNRLINPAIVGWSTSKVNRRIKTRGTAFKKQMAYIESNKPLWSKVPKICTKDKQVQISSAATEGHRNPHLSTLAGIITRAIVCQEENGIDIYLTSQVLTEQIEGFMRNFGELPADLELELQDITNEEALNAARMMKPKEGELKLFWDEDGSYYRIWQLRPNIDPKFGTIILDPWNKTYDPNPAWQAVSFTEQFWIEFHEQNFTTKVRTTVGGVDKRPMVKKMKEKREERKKRKEEVKEEKAEKKKQEIEKKKEESKKRPAGKTLKDKPTTKPGRKTNTLITKKNDSEDEFFTLQADDSIFLDEPVSNDQVSIMNNSADPEPTQSQVDIQMEKVLKKAVGVEGLLSPDTFTKFDIKASRLISEGLTAFQVIVDYLWFPDTESSVDFHIRYANDEFVADGYKMTLKNLWSTIPRGLSTIDALAASIMLPGKDSSIKIDDFLSIHDCGLVVERTSPIINDLHLKSIFGTASFSDEKSFQPFGDIITLRLLTIRLQIGNLFSITPLKVFVRIQENISIKDVLVPVVFETRRSRGGDQTIYQLSYIAAAAGQGLTPAQILDWLSPGDLDLSAIPGLKKLMKSVQILSLTLGWHGSTSNKSFSAKPDFIEITIELDQLKLVPDILSVERAILELRLDRAASGYDLSLTSHAEITIGQCAVEFFIAYGDRPEWFNVYGDDDIPGHLKLSLNTTYSGSLSLSNILGHFMPNVQCLPPAFQTLLTKTGITKFRLGVEENDSGHNSISMLDIEIVLEEDDITVFEGLSISRPQFNLRIDYPSDKDRRTINASISVTTTIHDEDIKATIWLDSGEDTIVGVTLFPTDNDIPLGDIITFFGQKLSECLNLPTPKDFSYLEDITAGPIYLSFRKSSDEGFKIDSFFIAVEADREFELWNSPLVSFSNVTFAASYIRGSGMHIGFGISLAVGSYQLMGNLSYDCAYHDSTITDESQKVDGTPTKDLTAYTAKVRFEGELSLHEILSKMTGVNIKDVLHQTQLDSITKYTDITIHTVDLRLSKTTSTWAIKLAADLEWLAFNKISLEAYRAESWAFNLRLECKDGPLNILPDSWASDVRQYVDFGDTKIYLFYGSMKDSLGNQQLSLDKNSMGMLQSKGGVAIATTLKFGSKLDLFKEWLKVEDIKVFGAAGPEFFILGVELKRLTLFQDESLSIVGRFLLFYNSGGIAIGLEGEFGLNLPAISNTTIAGTVEAGIDLSNGRLALGFTTQDNLKNLCKVQGLDLDAIVIRLWLDPAAEMIPTRFDLHGGIRIQGINNVSGQFIAKDPLDCYIEGEIKNLNLMSLLGKFAAALDLPEAIQSFLNNNGINLQYLAIQLVPKDMVDVTNGKILRRRFYFEGTLSLVINGDPIWAGYTLIDINDSGFEIIALMEPIQLVHEDVFSLKRFQDPSTAQYKLELPKVNPDYLTPRMLNEGPVLKFASKGPDPVFVSAQLAFLGTYHTLYAVAKESGFFATFKSKAPIGSFELTVNLVLNSNIDVVSILMLDLGEQFLQISGALGLLDGALDPKSFKKASESSTSVSFSGTLKIGIAWAAGRDPLSVELFGKVHAFDHDWDLGSISVKITEDDLRTLQNLASRLWEYIKNEFSNLVMGWIRDAETAVKTAIAFIEDNWKLVEQDLARLVADLKDLPVASVVEPVLRELQTTYEDARRVYEDLGFQTFMAIKLLIPIYGENPPPDRRPDNLPDVPEDILDLPKPPGPSGPMGIPISSDLLRGLPGFENPPQKPTPAPEPVPVPATPATNPFADIPISFPFSTQKPASGSGDIFKGFINGFGISNNVSEDVLAAAEAEEESITLEAAPEDVHTPLQQASGVPLNAVPQPNVIVARLPTWYTNEIEQYLESTITQSNSSLSHAEAAPVHNVIRQIASFSKGEVVNIAKSLRLSGFSDADIQKAYQDSFGQDMPPQVLARV